MTMIGYLNEKKSDLYFGHDELFLTIDILSIVSIALFCQQQLMFSRYSGRPFRQSTMRKFVTREVSFAAKEIGPIKVEKFLFQMLRR